MTILNTREFDLMQSPLRRLAQRHVELAAFRRMLRDAGVELRGGAILDVGCGSGYGLELLRDTFAPGHLMGFDLMPEQVALARSRAPYATVVVGDATAIPAPDASFDAVSVFAILHHVPAWRVALTEIARVLKPGGVLVVEELSGEAVALSDRFVGTSHRMDSRFTWPDFRAGIAAAGLSIVDERAVVGRLVRAFLARKGEHER